MNKNKKSRQLNAAGQISAGEMDKEVARVSALDLDELRREWKSKFRAPPPCLRSRDTLRGCLRGKSRPPLPAALTRRPSADCAT